MATLTLELTDEERARLETLAAQKGQDAGDFAAEIVRANLDNGNGHKAQFTPRPESEWLKEQERQKPNSLQAWQTLYGLAADTEETEEEFQAALAEFMRNR